jgi:hypothetical protein
MSCYPPKRKLGVTQTWSGLLAVEKYMHVLWTEPQQTAHAQSLDWLSYPLRAILHSYPNVSTSSMQLLLQTVYFSDGLQYYILIIWSQWINIQKLSVWCCGLGQQWHMRNVDAGGKRPAVIVLINNQPLIIFYRLQKTVVFFSYVTCLWNF